MYCSGCGTQLQTELNYCNRCGRRVASDSEKASVAESLSTSVGYVGAAGFLAYIFVVIALAKNGIPGNQIIPITFFYFAALFGICFLIIRQTQLFSAGSSKKEPETIEDRPAAYLRPVTTAQLHEPADDGGLGSVTDHTTRTLDKVNVQRR